MCIGRDFALLEARLIVATIARRIRRRRAVVAGAVRHVQLSIGHLRDEETQTRPENGRTSSTKSIPFLGQIFCVLWRALGSGKAHVDSSLPQRSTHTGAGRKQFAARSDKRGKSAVNNGHSRYRWNEAKDRENGDDRCNRYSFATGGG